MSVDRFCKRSKDNGNPTLDIAVLWDNDTQVGDIQFKNSDLVREDGLTSAVLLSLFLDSRANDDSGITDPDKKRGWWGDLLQNDTDFAGTGSNLWLLSREKVDKQTINVTEQYITDSLQWMITDGVIKDLDVDVSVGGDVITPILQAEIKLSFSDGETQVIEFANLWEAQFKETYYINEEGA